MKSNIKLMFAAGMMLLATGCTDLDVPLKSQYPSYPNSEVALNAQLNSIYSHFRSQVMSKLQFLIQEVGLMAVLIRIQVCMTSVMKTIPLIGWVNSERAV